MVVRIFIQPLHGLSGIPGTTSMPVLQLGLVSIPQISGKHAVAWNNLNKTSVSCYFFQKGKCLKGGRHPFMQGLHSTGPQRLGIPVLQRVTKGTEFVVKPTVTFKTELSNLKETTSTQAIPKESIKKAAEALGATDKYVKSYQPDNVPVSCGGVASMLQSNQSQLTDERLHHGRYGDEFLGSSSAGLGMVVEDDVGDSRYLHKEHYLVKESVKGGKNLCPVTDFNYHCPDSGLLFNPGKNQVRGKYKDEFYRERQLMTERSGGHVEESPDYYREMHSYDQKQHRSSCKKRVRYREESPSNYGALHRHYDHEELRSVYYGRRVRHREESHDYYGNIHNHYRGKQPSASMRIMDRPLMSERWAGHREERLNEVDGSDLRLRLLKQKRLNASRSVVSPDRHGDHNRSDKTHIEMERDHGNRHAHRNHRHFTQENSMISHLQSRVDVPVIYSPDRPLGKRSQRKRHRERHRDRLFTTKTNNYPEKNNGKMKLQLPKDMAIDKRRDDSDLNFADPKSLAELKGAKVSQSSQEHSTKRITDRLSTKSGEDTKSGEEDGFRESLIDALKRKREAAAVAISRDGNDNNDGDGVEGALASYESEPASGMQLIPLSCAAKEGNPTVHNFEETKVVANGDEEEEGLIPKDGEVVHSSTKLIPEMKESMMAETEEDGEVKKSEESDVHSQTEVQGGMIAEAAKDNEVVYSDEKNLSLDNEGVEARTSKKRKKKKRSCDGGVSTATQRYHLRPRCHK